MNEEKLKELLEKYYNGNSTDDEELLLRKYFTGNNKLPGYKAEMEIFNYYSLNEKAQEPSDDLESRILGSIDLLEKKQKQIVLNRKILPLLSIAASFLLLIGTYFFFINKSKEPKDTFSDPQLAYTETKRILYDISIKLNRGTQALQQAARTTQTGLESIEKSADLISGQFERIEHLGRLMDNVDQKK